MNIEQLQTQVERRVDCARESLANRCTGLAAHLNYWSAKLKSDTPHISLCINDLGEIQSQGTIIDAECGRLGAMISVLNMIESNGENNNEH